MSKWPRDNQAALIKFYGDPGTGEVERQLVKVTPPFKMYYEGKLLQTITFHKKGSQALLGALNTIWDYYDHDQALIDKHEISKYSGTYNPRKVRNSKTKWSNHAYGAAIDLDSEDNGFGAGKGDLPPAVIAAFKSEGFSWGGDYKGRTDPMHFELCDRGEPQRSFDEWLAALGAPRKVKSKLKTVAAVSPASLMDFAPEPSGPELPPRAGEDINDFPSTPAALAAPAKPVTPPPAAEGVQGDPEIWNVQRRLKAMNYNPGGLDGVWGGLTAGAISGFINDRKLTIAPPTSPDAFLLIQETLKSELGRAEAETVRLDDGTLARFARPVSPERAAATAETLAPKLPEVKAAVQAERLGFWAAISAFVSSTVTGVAKFMGDAVEWLNPVKEFIGDLPWGVWVGGALVVSAALYYISRKSGEAKDASTQAYQEGSRS